MATRISDGAFCALAGVVASLFAADAYLIRQLHIVQQDTAHLDRYVSVSIGVIRQNAAIINDAHREGIEALIFALAEDRHITEAAAADAVTSAQRHTTHLARRVALHGQDQMAWAKGELSGMHATATQVSESAHRMANQLRDVRFATQTVQTGNGRVGTASTGLHTQVDMLAAAAARQRDALAAERAADAREGFEFHVRKSPYPYAFKYFSLRLNKVDPKRNRYSLDVLTANGRIETVERTINEPVWLVSARGRTIELVVREIGKDDVRGSVTVPRSREMASDYYSSGRADTDSFPGR